MQVLHSIPLTLQLNYTTIHHDYSFQLLLQIAREIPLSQFPNYSCVCATALLKITLVICYVIQMLFWILAVGIICKKIKHKLVLASMVAMAYIVVLLHKIAVSDSFQAQQLHGVCISPCDKNTFIPGIVLKPCTH